MRRTWLDARDIGCIGRLRPERAREVARHEFDARLRSVEQGPDGAIWIAEDGKDGKVLKLTPQ
jgi:glucose/arabinose dehydrogenase